MDSIAWRFEAELQGRNQVPSRRRNGRRNFPKVESEMCSRRGWSLVHLIKARGWEWVGLEMLGLGWSCQELG